MTVSVDDDDDQKERESQLLGAAVSALRSGDAARSLELIDQLIEISPGNSRALQIEALAVLHTEGPAVAYEKLRYLLQLYPDDAQGWFNAGIVAGRLKRPGQAVLHYRQALRLRPDHPDTIWNLSELLRLDEQYEETLDLLEKLEPNRTFAHEGDFYHRKAVTLAGLGRLAQASDYFEKALAVETTNPPLTSWEYSSVLLAREEFALGWEHYEQRGNCQGLNGITMPRVALPAWDGDSLDGRTLLIHGEQGLGDEILFSSMVNDIEGDLILACKQPLLRLFGQSFEGKEVIGLPESDGALRASRAPDVQLPVGSLGKYFRRNASDFAEVRPWLSSDPVDVEQMRERLERMVPGIARNLKVGIAWGSTPSSTDISAKRRARNKSIPVKNLINLADFGRNVSFVSLHNYQVSPEAAGAAGIDIIDMSLYLQDMADTAALVDSLDVVISVDTSIANLAGAMGKPVWVLLMKHADWRWGEGALNTSWFPRARLFRQSSNGDWAELLARVSDALESLQGR